MAESSKVRPRSAGETFPAPIAVVGRQIVWADAGGTVLFAITALVAAASFTTTAQWVGAVTALGLFAVGVFAFLWSYLVAVGRSRTEEISVVQLYLLTGAPTPRFVKRIMLGLLATQIAIAMATTFARLDGPDGKPGSSLAVGFLVPMFGFAMNGLWASKHATFALRRRRDATPAQPEGGAVRGTPKDVSDQSAIGAGGIGQTDDHG